MAIVAVMLVIFGIIGLVSLIFPKAFVTEEGPDHVHLNLVGIIAMLVHIFISMFPKEWQIWIIRSTGLVVIVICSYLGILLHSGKPLPFTSRARAQANAPAQPAPAPAQSASSNSTDDFGFDSNNSAPAAAQSAQPQNQQPAQQETAAQSANAPQPASGQPANNQPAAPAAQSAPAQTAEQADALLKQANDAWLKKDYASSLKCAEEAYKIRQTVLGANDPKTIEVQNMINTAKKQMEQPK